MAWGMFIGARRELMITLQDRALRAEEEQALRVAQARGQERERIAREMHDVLAHRISLVCMHAGALTYRNDATPEEVAHSAEIIARNAHLALEDLREVIGVLREGEVDGGPERPQPGLRDLPELVAEARSADMNVRLSSTVADPESAPDTLGRSAYRIVQEGLTNARKHAPNTRVDVMLAGGPGQDLTVEIRNRQRVGAGAPTIPGTGTGLLGLAERVELAGGELTHGPTSEGDFVVCATLPWPA
jgi:signal transduction histidine kinase